MDWETKRIKDVFSFSKGLSITKEDLVENGVPVISYGQIHSKQNKGVKIDDSLIRFVGEEYLKSGEKSLTNKHDFLFADTSEDFEGCGNNVYVDRDMTLFAGYHTIILRNKKPQDCRYFAYQFNSDDWRTQIRKATCGIKVYSITQKTLSNISLLVPPESIQKKISDFLDVKTQNIDSRIEILEKKKERYLILRKAIISENVNNNKRWNSVRLKDCLYEPLKYGANATGIEYDEKLPRYIRITDIDEDGKLRNDDIQSLPLEIANEYILNDGDILLARSGATAGKSFLYKEKYGKASYAGYLIKASLNKSCLPQFFYYYTQSIEYDNWKNKNIIQATIQNLAADKYNYLSFGLPTTEEQERIVRYLDKKTSAIDSIVEKITKEIDSLKTYRRALINEAVTGKLNIE